MARFKIKKKTAIKLFKALGFKTAENWTTDRLQSKLNNLPEITDETKVDDKFKDYLKRIEKADEVIIKEKEVEDMKTKKDKKKKGKKKAEVEEAPVTKKSKKADKKKTDKKKVSKKVSKKVEKKTTKKVEKTTAKKTTTAKVEKKKDRFGSTIGTFASQVNEVLSTKPQSRKQILIKVGRDGSCSSHLKKLVAKGFLVQLEDKSYKLKK